MSARANPYDNACTESFIGTLKGEMLQNGCFQNATDARTEIFDYIEGYYNTHRKHSALALSHFAGAAVPTREISAEDGA